MMLTALLGIYVINAMEAPTQTQGLAGNSDTKPVVQKFDPSKWKLEWADEFQGGPEPNPKNWSYEEGYIRNGEAQYYTKNRRENARIENGRLVIEARKDGFLGKPISSASLITLGKKEFLYGRIEARAKVPTGRGTWPAIWTLGTNIGKVGWPKCGELDILEHVGFDPNVVHANVHVDAFNHTKGNGRGNRIPVQDPHLAFHLFAVEWTKDRIDFFFNDTKYLTYRKEAGWGDAEWPFDKPQYLILNLAIGGGWGGAKGVDEALFPHRYEIDYVRYYKAK